MPIYGEIESSLLKKTDTTKIVYPMCKSDDWDSIILYKQNP